MMKERPKPKVSCGYTWGSDGKSHICILDQHEEFQLHECDCGMRSGTKRPRGPLKLAVWKRGKRVK